MNTEEQKKKRKKTLVVVTAVVCGVLLVGCLNCFVVGSLVPQKFIATPVVPATATYDWPEPEGPPAPIIVTVVVTAAPPIVTTAANATNEAEIYAIQTLTAMPTVTSTPTPTLTSTPFPTYTPYPTQTPRPTYTPWPTLAPPPTAVPATPPPVAICDCSYNRYNCANFSTQRQAQTCYNYCRSIGAGDVHRLDADNDGWACESLP